MGDVQVAYRRRRRIYMIGSKVEGALLNSLKAVTKEIAAIKKYGIAGWKN